mmetsp:Transcript_35391/g.79833  ORF Transcript_35391/g.79833 Transcript_35391/m.79833 type:complete len:380 (+) Transcript_35391:236-1375(+)
MISMFLILNILAIGHSFAPTTFNQMALGHSSTGNMPQPRFQAVNAAKEPATEVALDNNDNEPLRASSAPPDFSERAHIDEVQSDFDLRFGGVARLYGRTGLAKLRQSHVVLVGVGGVGGWAAEALGRSGVGKLSLVDLDTLCISNTNRQLHALKDTVGGFKTTVLKQRLLKINPQCSVAEAMDFVDAGNVRALLDGLGAEQGLAVDLVVDLIDSLDDKAALLSECRRRGVPCIVVGAAGGKRDSTRTRISDLAQATNDRLIKALRKLLRKKHAFPPEVAGKVPDPWGVTAVFVDEKARPESGEDDGGGGVLNYDEAADKLVVGGVCDTFGTSCFVAGSLGFAAACAAVDVLLGRSPPEQWDYKWLDRPLLPKKSKATSN